MPIRLTRAVKALLILNFAFFIVQQTADQFFGADLLSWLGLVPSAFLLGFRFWQIITYSFLHGDVMHLFLNLMMLAFIGGELEARWGTRKFLKFYFFCSTSAGVLYLFLQLLIWKGAGLHTPMVGASGAIYGLLAAYGLVFGERMLLFMMLFPMKAKHFIWVLAGIEFMSTVYSGRSGLASAAHIGGMIAGFGYLWGGAAWTVFRKRRGESSALAAKEKRKKAAGHLKLVVNQDKGKAKGEFPESPDSPDSDDKPTTWH